MKFILIAALLIASVAANPKIGSRITSGYSVKAGVVKCFVQLVVQGEDGSKTCGGCLIFPEERILTSASCLYGSNGAANSILFYTGLTGSAAADAKLVFSNVYKSSEYVVGLNSSGADLAIVMLSDRVKTTANFAGAFTNLEEKADAFVGENLVTCGFGFTDNNKTKAKTLQCTTLRVVPAIECATVLAASLPTTTTTTAASGSRRKRA
jgi:secreted trypsin-like serine protease